ncbi:MAG: amino acid permease [Desulfovermiculus sp.]
MPSIFSGSGTPFQGYATGMPRFFSVFDGFIYGVYANSIVIAAALTYSLTWPWNDANIPLGILMVCLAFIPMFTVYAMLTALMPRAGGEYVWKARAFGGFWACVFIFTPLVLGPWFYMASNVAPGSAMVVAPVLISLAGLWDMPIFVDLAIMVSTRTGTWWFYVFYVSFAAGVMLLGMRFYARFQRWSFFVGILALGTWIVMLLATGSAEFQTSFSDFVQETLHWGDGEAYQRILDAAREDGFSAVPLAETSVKSSFLIGPVLAYTFMYIAWTGTLVGEIRGVHKLKNSSAIFLGGNIFSMILCAGFMWLLISRVGNEFFTSANFLWATDGEHIPVPPHYGLYLMALSRSPWFWLWVAVGLNAWFWIWPTNNMVMSTRIMMAMSNDRVLPVQVGTLSRVLGTPVTAVLICYIGALLLGWLYFFTGFSRLTLNMPFMTSLAFAATTLAGTLFPFLKNTRPVYENSPISRYTLLGIPLISVAGVLGLAYFAVMFYLYIMDDRYGTNDPLSAWFIIGSVTLSALGYLWYKARRRRKGMDIEVTHLEIPVK